jgi:cytochrome P450
MGLQDQGRVAKIAKMMDTVSLGLHSFPALNFPGSAFYRATKAANAIRKEIRLLIKEKKEAITSGAQTHDFLSYMICSTDPTGRFMPEQEVADKVMGLLAAAFKSPSIATTFLMKYLGERPDINLRQKSERVKVFSRCRLYATNKIDNMTIKN